MGRHAAARAQPDACRRHHGVPRLGAGGAAPQARGDELVAARDGGDAEFRAMQSRPAHLCGAQAHRHRAPVRAHVAHVPEKHALANRRVEAGFPTRLAPAKAGDMRHQKCPARIAGAHARDLPKAQSAHSYAEMHRTACFRPHSKGTAFMSIRPVKRIIQSKPTIEGAGVKLARAFGFGDTAEFDPFLLLDDFRNDRPEDYRGGFPWHPHRGIETITYVLAGSVDHGDSLGNRGKLGAGDVQWMTAGRGILHQEMPLGDSQGKMHGFQLWANLPSSLKMTAPRYQDIKAAEIPEIVDDDGTRVRVVCGDFWGRRGPVEGVAADPRYLDIFVPPGKRKTLPVETGRHAFAYVFEGSGTFSSASQPFGVLTEQTVDRDETLIRERTGNRSLVLFDSGDEVTAQAGEEGMRFLLVSGKPIEEPVAWYGPIVMNTQAELERAFAELRQGTFIKRG